ncbi:unsaturated glucuronyl hydrolase [Stagonosporopsis vannaccii]|nr:unsaturated glucuronyl hydrolase [Stagonosporopsis vannaccii]
MIETDSHHNPLFVKPGRKRGHIGTEQNERRVRDVVLTPPKDDDLVADSEAFTELSSDSTASLNARDLSLLFGTSVELKIWGMAARGLRLKSPPSNYPEYTKPGENDYVYRDLKFWTSGFFPGSLHLLYERRMRFGHILRTTSAYSPGFHDLQLEFACKYWTESLHQNAYLGNTHDLGFMIMPWARVAYEVNHDLRSLETIKTAAQSLLSRYNEEIGCVRSWDQCITKKYNFYDTESDFMVIIDNMMNLDLLFYAASKTGNERMFAAAVSHARTTARTHIRSDGSTTHLVVLNTKDGTIKHRLTNQGYSHTSCWARGQSWAIAGFAETYTWTRDTAFLDVACQCANYFMNRIPESGIVPWDFDAPVGEGISRPSDVSAAMVAAYGMLLVHQALLAQGKSSSYLKNAFVLIRAACAHHINPPATLVTDEKVVETVEYGKSVELSLDVNMVEGDTILKGATINNYEFAPRRWANHGLVYADYYFLLVGNKLLELGFGPANIDK